MISTTGIRDALFVGLTAVGLLICGCGEQPPPGEGDNQTGTEESEQTNGETAEDCGEGEYFHPIEEECRVEDDDSEQQNGGNDGNDDEESNDDDPTINQDEQNSDEQPCGNGSIKGQSCRPDRGVLPGAEVTVAGEDCDGQSFEKTTSADSDGNYEFDEVPAGEHELTVTSGSFTNTDEVKVQPDQETDLTSEAAKICLDGSELEIAVFDGMFDDVDQVLDNMEIEYDYYDGGSSLGSDGTDLILDLDALLEYDILFIECQVDIPDPPNQEVALSNLRRFIHEGNSVYASDRAHPWIFLAFPDAIPYELEYDDDADDLRSQIQNTDPGGSTGTYTADVLSDEMYTLLGTDTVEFNFDTGSWTIVDDETGPLTTAHFSLDPDTWGSGTYEGASAVTTYDDPIKNGRIIYTSFHNSKQEQMDSTMEDILEYMIFQL